jgi:hypothetical protein
MFSANRLEGSSPHTRGAPARCLRQSRCSRDHPRIRGEHASNHRRIVIRHGIIPAYAGSTAVTQAQPDIDEESFPHTRGALTSSGWTDEGAKDHPRIRGEHGYLLNSGWSSTGSSPHTRGAHAAHEDRPCGVGIIPAYAGSTWKAQVKARDKQGSSPHTRGALTKRATTRTTSRDHPRIRGEHRTSEPDAPMYMGSSPHTRGAPWRWSWRSWRSWDHPRIRGEHRVLGEVGLPGVGIIPAYAGSTSCFASRSESRLGSSPHTRGAPRTASASATRWRDHPRIRGEHAVLQGVQPVPAGIIPAYAGSTPLRAHRSSSVRGSSPHTRGARAGMTDRW